MNLKDVPSPIDLQKMEDAREWERTALEKRPERPVFFAKFADEIRSQSGIKRVLELGSGPGFLANHLLMNLDDITYVALDYSPAMHELAKQRLQSYQHRITYVEKNFKIDGWCDGLGSFDCVVTNQSVHELRHKSYAAALHAKVRTLLNDGGIYLVNDHFAGVNGMSNNQLYMSRIEQQKALFEAGFLEVTEIIVRTKMALIKASR